MNNDKVTSYFKLPSLKLTELKTKLDEVDKKYPAKSASLNKAYLFGIEVEVENITNQIHKLNYWTITRDNSLRNNGLEFVSLPLRSNQIEGAIQELTEALPKDASFSERTSCHVHMNVRDLTISEIYNVLIIYMAMENVLFKWVGHGRDKNIFCLPLTETNFYKNLKRFESEPRHTIEYWNKYTALNIIPILEKGTVEFRHMYGTIDSTTMLTWITFLCCIKDAAKRWETHKLEERIQQLNTNSEYSQFITEIFTKYADVFADYDLQDLMEVPISQLKLAINNNHVEQPLTRVPRRPTTATINNLARGLYVPELERQHQANININMTRN